MNCFFKKNYARLLILPALLALGSTLFAQKKALSYQEIGRWRKIEQTKISRDGQWAAYTLKPHTEGDAELTLWSAANNQTIVFPRSADPAFSADNRFLAFRIKPPLDTLKAQRRRKVKDEDLPKDTLAIYRLADGRLEKTPNLKSFELPAEWAGLLVCTLEPDKGNGKKEEAGTKPDSTAAPKQDKKLKKEGKETGSKMLLFDLAADRCDTVWFVSEFALAKKAPKLLFYTTGADTTVEQRGLPATAENGVYAYDAQRKSLQPLWRSVGKFQQLSWENNGNKAAFLADTDTSKARVRPWQLGLWNGGADSARLVAGPNSAFLPEDAEGRQIISEHARPQFSEDGSKLYFGIASQPILQDTSLLPEEIVQVEVWTWKDPRLYTEQEKRLDSDKKQYFPVALHLASGAFARLGGPDLPEVRFQPERNAERAMAFTETPYLIAKQWEGEARKDVYALDVRTGARTLVRAGLRGNPQLSPGAQYITWWSDPDSCWFAWAAATNQTRRLTANDPYPFFEEENDVPDYPGAYGLAGWLENDQAMLVYDQFDLYRVDPTGAVPPKRLTKGREENRVYRYIRLDPEERSIKANAVLLLHRFDKTNKSEGYAWLNLATGQISLWYEGAFAFTKNVIKAKDANAVLFSCENFQTYPDLLYSTFTPGKTSTNPQFRRVSNANPQQAEYLWGNIELVRWTSLDGEALDGLLVKPENFNPDRQYPMLVYFYERLSDGLHQHRAPDAGRSSINPTIYASRGYLVFLPDIHYRTGYPGESAYNAVMSGVQHLTEQGFVDKKRIGLQGHSWGGYQAAYLVTRTNLFACAEAGAPVANMTSAYGGIRWESGLNRQFQYERQQSRIGGSLWEYPMRYLENSPLFALDKVRTPLLILHNDEDGAVPWYQGIELFTGLRRLGKPCWLLNYNGEPHWPVKLQNRVDFQTRMLQFFDHYLQEGPLPGWMEEGVTPGEKGIRQKIK